MVAEKREEQAVDSSLACYPVEEVKQVFHIAHQCLEQDPSKRPTMNHVFKMLEQLSPS